MNVYEVAFSIVSALDRLQIEYAIVGGIATLYYGYARTTDDVDLLLRVEDVHRLNELVRELGPGAMLDPQPAFEVFTGKTYRQIRLAGVHVPIDIFPVTAEAYDREQFRRRRQVKLLEHRVYLPSPEDVIVMKLRWQRHKDLADALVLIGVQMEALDWSYLERWCDAFSVRNLLDDLRRKVLAK